MVKLDFSRSSLLLSTVTNNKENNTFLAYERDLHVVSHYWPTCLSIRADADKRGNTVNAGGAGAASSCGTVVDIFGAVWSTPAINADTDVGSNSVAASTSILTSVWLQMTLIHILCTVLTCVEGKN